jgi:hypothetical protein
MHHFTLYPSIDSVKMDLIQSSDWSGNSVVYTWASVLLMTDNRVQDIIGRNCLCAKVQIPYVKMLYVAKTE